MKNLQQMLKNQEYEKIWDKYCGFLDLNIEEFMQIQERLLMEQLEMYSKSRLGKIIMGPETKPTTIDEFREMVPLTTYEDYAEILLNKDEDALPAKPVYWIQTTWKGGTHDIKVAPCSESMVEEHTKAFIASLILATSKKRGEFSLRDYDKFLYGMAPLPYLTGLAPHVLQNEIDFEYLPSIEEAESLGFEERNKVGFDLALNKGVDLFFGLSSVLVKIGEEFVKKSEGSSRLPKPNNLKMLYKYIKVFIKKNIKKETILPKDLFDFKGIICAGTDTHAFKDKIEYYWGKRPLEIFGGTEITTVATESWGGNGLTFFPDVNFLEFIPEKESLKSLHDKNYQPKTLLLNEIKPNERYELVTTKFKGGAFVRYRVGDMIECLSLENKENNIKLPQIRYVDRIANVIDLAGFTRITKNTINKAIDLSELKLANWVACKEFENSEPLLHLYLELENKVESNEVKSILHSSLQQADSDYHDIEMLLGRNPLKVTLLKQGSFKKYKQNNKFLIKMNPCKDTIAILTN